MVGVFEGTPGAWLRVMGWQWCGEGLPGLCRSYGWRVTVVGLIGVANPARVHGSDQHNMCTLSEIGPASVDHDGRCVCRDAANNVGLSPNVHGVPLMQGNHETRTTPASCSSQSHVPLQLWWGLAAKWYPRVEPVALGHSPENHHSLSIRPPPPTTTTAQAILCFAETWLTAAKRLNMHTTLAHHLTHPLYGWQ